MKTFLLFTGSSPLAILTSFDSITSAPLLERLKAKGITKFIYFEVPTFLARERYGTHFSVIEHHLNETDDLRILDYNGQRAFKMFSFEELGTPYTYDGE